MTDTITINQQMAKMTMTAETRARALQAAYMGEALSRAFAAVGRTVASLYRRWREWSETRRSIAYLEGLDDRLLADIGLDRATLDETLNRPARQPDAGHAEAAINAVVAEAVPAKAAANQDHPVERTAA